jgi:hypothetical protein
MSVMMMTKLQNNQSVNCVVFGKLTTSTTDYNQSQTMIIKPCTMDCGCFIKEHNIWCNHCCDVYMIIEEIIEKNPLLSHGVYMGICMRELRGKCSGELCDKFIRLLTERRNG